MARIEKFEDIHAWQKARVLAKDVYLVSKSNFNNDFAFKDQIRRACGSVMDNIAEGYERGGKREFIQFLSVAKASAGEVRSQLYRALDMGYIDDDVFNDFYERSNEVGKMIKGLISYLQDTDFKGLKFKS